MKVKVLGIDPSLRNFGLAIAEYDIEGNSYEVVDLLLLSTETTKVKTMRRNCDDLERARYFSTELRKVIGDEIHYCFAEIPVGSQSARAMASYGICIGVISAIPIPVYTVLPHESKIAATSCKTASKDEMIEWAMNKFPKAPWLKRKSKGEVVLKKENEHLADACGAIEAGIRLPAFQEVMTVYKVLNSKKPIS